MKDAARRESWCELQNTQIIDVPNVHDGRKSNGQVRFSVKTNLIRNEERERDLCCPLENLICIVMRDDRASCARFLCEREPVRPDHSALGVGTRFGKDDGTRNKDAAPKKERRSYRL